MQNNYKAVVFDYEGVLEFSHGGNPVNIASEIASIPFEDLKTAYLKHNHLSNVENMDWMEMFKLVLAEFNLDAEILDKTLETIEAGRSEFSLNKELIGLLPQISNQDLELAIFSNYTSALRVKLRENKLDTIFDRVVISGEISFQKPSKESFEFLFNELNLKPEEVIFIDDTTKSLEGADAIGYTPILYKSNEQLKSDLNKLGVII